MVSVLGSSVEVLAVHEETEAVCLSCFKWFDVNKPNANLGFGHLQLYRRFQTFARDHLRLSPKVLQRLGKALSSAEGGSGRPPVFCLDCENLLITICNLYGGLCEVKTQLAGKMGNLADLFESARKANFVQSEEELDSDMMNRLATQMNMEGDRSGITEIRSQMASKCRLKSVCNVRTAPKYTPIQPSPGQAPKQTTQITQVPLVTVLTPITLPSQSLQQAKTVTSSSSIMPQKNTKRGTTIHWKPKPPPKQNFGGNRASLPPSPISQPIKKFKTYPSASELRRNSTPALSDCTIERSTERIIIKKKAAEVITLNDDNSQGGSSTSVEPLQMGVKLPADIELLEVTDDNSQEEEEEPEPSEDIKLFFENRNRSRHHSESSKVTAKHIKLENQYENIFIDEVEDPYNDDNAELYDRSNENSTSSNSRQPFAIGSSEEIIITPRESLTFIDEEEDDDSSYNPLQIVENESMEEDSCSQPLMQMPLDVSIEEVDQSISGDWSNDDLDIKITDVTSNGESPPAQRKRKKPATDTNTIPPIDPSSIPDDIPSFVSFFKRRRLSMKLTQSDVSKLLGSMYDNGDELFSQTTVSRFEAMNLTEKNMEKLKPIFERWLKESDPRSVSPPEGTSSNRPTIICNGKTITPGRRKKRTNIDQKAMDIMEARFRENQRPDTSQLDELAYILNMEREVVRVWFCNRRQRQKKDEMNNPHASGILINRNIDGNTMDSFMTQQSQPPSIISFLSFNTLV